MRIEADGHQHLVSGDVIELGAIAAPAGLRAGSARYLNARTRTREWPHTNSGATVFREGDPLTVGRESGLDAAVRSPPRGARAFDVRLHSKSVVFEVVAYTTMSIARKRLMSYCARCRSRIEDAAQFCSVCGSAATPVTGANAQSTTVPPRRRIGLWKQSLLVTLGIVVVFAAAFLCWQLLPTRFWHASRPSDEKIQMQSPNPPCRSCPYLNNIVDDYRAVKRRILNTDFDPSARRSGRLQVTKRFT